MNKAEQAQLEEEVAWDMWFRGRLNRANRFKTIPPRLRVNIARSPLDDDEFERALEVLNETLTPEEIA